MIHNRNTLLLSVAAASLLWPAGALFAATADQTAKPSDKNEVQAVVVTANRRNDIVQNVAGQVTALTGSDLSNMHASSFNDFATQVPGLSFQSNSPTNNLVAIRGVASSTAELGSAVSIYLDDVPLGASTQFGLGSQSFNFNLFDMDRVEVLNGPQGTVYGANALGGALKYITTKPQLGAYGGKAEVDASSTDHGGANGAARLEVNLPLLDGTAAVRVDGLTQYDSGYAKDPAHARENIGASRTTGGRIALLYKPTDALEVRLAAFTQNIAANGADVAFMNPQTHAPLAGAYDQSYALSQPADSSVTAYSAVISYDFNWAKATSVSAYQRNHGLYHTDDTVFYGVLMPLYTGLLSTAAGPYDLYVDTNTKKFTQEVRLASPDNKHLEWVGGLFYTHETTDELVILGDAAQANGYLPAPYSSAPFWGYLPSTYDEVAAFGDATWYITPKFDVTIGARYSQQNQKYSSNIWWVGFGPPYGQIYPYTSTSDQGVATYLVNPRYHVTEDVMLYARASSGFRPGGPNFVLPAAFASPAPSTFKPDRIWNYEVGEKGAFLDHRLTFDLDAYDIEWKGIQTTENVNGINQLVNAGDGRVQGAETSLAYRATRALSLNASGAYTDAQLTTTAPVLGVFYKGARLPLSPKYTFAVSAAYRFEPIKGVPARASLSDVWVGDRTSGYAGSATNVLYRLPEYNTVNANLALYLPNGVEADAYVKNLFDERGQLSATTLNNVFFPTAGVPVALSQPLTVGVTLKLAWGGK